MTDRTRLGLVAATVLVFHAALAVLWPSPEPLPPPPQNTTWIGLSAPVPPAATRPPKTRARATGPTVAPVPVPTATPASEFALPADQPAASAAPGEPPPPTPLRPAAPEPVPTPPKVSTDAVLARLVYPTLALRRRLEATVVLELAIDEAGRVTPTVVEDPGHGFAEAAVRALQGLVVVPAMTAGRPVSSRLRYPVRFVLP